MTFRWVRDLDSLLRGERTSEHALHQGLIDTPIRVFVPMAGALGAIYGFFMGWYALSGPRPDALKQLVASTFKLPLLFLLTLLVTFPSLYVLNALVGCRLGFRAAMRLLVASIVVNLAVGASLGPILAFFTLSTSSYPFIVLLNVVLLGIAGIISLGFLRRTLRRLEEAALRAEAASPEPDASDPDDPFRPPPLPRVTPGAAQGIFNIWVFIYAAVGCQMGWLLRPFIGNPDIPFTWFRDRGGSFFVSVIHQIGRLLGL